MTTYSHPAPERHPAVLVIGSTPDARNIGDLIALDERIGPVESYPSAPGAPIEHAKPAVVVLDAKQSAVPGAADYIRSMSPESSTLFLDSVRELTVGEFLNLVASLANENEPMGPSHLQAVPTPQKSSDHRDLREELSPRQLDVARLVAEGLSNKEISSRLGLSDKTVKNHISHILAKLKLAARTQIAVAAIRCGVV